MSELYRLQVQFARDLPRLIDKAFELGFEVTGGEWLRTKAQAALNEAMEVGIANSLHTLKLAIDLNLFRNGALVTDSDGHRALGEYWKSLGPRHRWGGDFRDAKGRPKPDGNHYSISPDGVRG